MSKVQIQMSKDYRKFEQNSENRRVSPQKHRKLKESMERYGFLRCFPIVVRRVGDKLIVWEGQHRLMFAEELGLPVWWVETDVDFDIAIVNGTAKTWSLRDYAEKYAANGFADYREGIEFADGHSLSIGLAFSLLAGVTCFSTCSNSFVDGTFKVRDRQWADAVVGLYIPMLTLSSGLKSTRFVEACMAVCRVPNFDQARMLGGAKCCRDKLISYSTRDAYLDMLQEIYNFSRKQLVDLKVQATMMMRERMTAAGNGKKSASNDQPATV